MLAGELVYLPLQKGRPVDADLIAPVVRDGRIGAIGGQFQPVRHPGQGFFPEAHLSRQRALPIGQITEIVPLPQRVIDVLDRQFGPAGGLPGTPADVGRDQVACQHADRPAVTGDVMDHDHHHVILLVNPEKLCPQRNFGGEMERVTCRFRDGRFEPVGRPPGCVHHLPSSVGTRGRHHDLSGYTVDRRKHRTQGFVPAHQIAQADAQRLLVELTAQPQRHRPVVYG